MDRINVCIIGSGNWATTIARNVGRNVANSQHMEPIVYMYVYEEIVDGRKLTEIINTTHINVKYMPDFVLPTNIVAVDDVVKTARDADILIFAIPPTFVNSCCKTLLGKVKPTAHAVSLIKGFERGDDGQIVLISQIIMRQLKIPCSVLVGCNLAHEIANDNFVEGTIGCRDQKYFRLLQDIFKSATFRVVVTDDADCVEICSTLRNVIAFGAGCADGMELNENTKAGIIRRGFLETLQFVDVFYPGCRMATFFEACGISDLVTSCYANRNRKLAEAFVKTGQPLSELEHILIPGHEPLGPVTAELVHIMLEKKGLADKFPLFTVIYKICVGDQPLTRLVETLRFAREDIFHPTHTFQL
ncbi:glycerol-3-phosphate dehydrogenase [NAD(+)], cytoplasmic [Drosophila willistoni]|uniref:glycerol-3-phosphate dehydrogenase [NAD(+)], cytoplasmic n=1 Tax=Drosophila willistoni TaxID=7260 RepID=UPI00017D6CFB|nr:glycerol-3-phosphate dehydrogenase [NAD(+)], cytoplasmic [Drosophila willistoni]